MTRRNAFTGPGFWNVDAGVYKSFKLGEKYTLQLRGEFYNMFNHSNLYVVYNATDISSNAFVQAKKGLPNATSNEQRHVQLAAKIIF